MEKLKDRPKRAKTEIDIETREDRKIKSQKERARTERDREMQRQRDKE